MNENILTLSVEQLNEVYKAMWREFVALHKQATINPYGLSTDVIKRIRKSRLATGQVCEMIEAMQPNWMPTDERYLAARTQAQIEVDHDLLLAVTKHGAWFVMPQFPNARKPSDLSTIAPFAFPVPASFRSRPSNAVLEVVELSIGLHGKDFATLSVDELKRFRLLRKIGRKYGLLIDVEIWDDNEDLQAEITAASLAQQEEIYRRLRTEIAVRWFAIEPSNQDA